MSVITLTTDFGLDNWFVGTMKGVIKNINPDVEIVDITHHVRPQNIFEAAFVLENSYTYFPAGTIHTVVVDPGVGSDRHAFILQSSRYYFVAPDNGVLSYSIDREKIEKIVKIESEKFLLHPVSSTFHGRDVFAPVSAYLSLGVNLEEFGPRLEKIVRLKPSVPKKLSDREIVGHVICVDPFGNLITDVTQPFLEELFKTAKAQRVRILIRDREIDRIRETYSQGNENELIALIGSSGHMEIAVNRGRASDALGMSEGGKFILRIAS
jgi:S-adenosylmethionine hydrolase